MRRRLLIIAATLLVFAVAGWTAYWFVMASRAADWIAVWAAPAPGKAWHGTFAAAETSGFPFRLTVRLADPLVTWQQDGGSAAWQGPWLEASFRPWSLARFDLVLPTEQTVTVDDGRSLRMIALTMASGHAWVEIEEDRARALDAELVDVVATWEQNRPPVAASRVVLAVAAVEPDPGAADAAAGPAWQADLRVEDARFPAHVAPPFKGEVTLLETSLVLRGEVPSGTPAQRLAGWRDAGGVVDIGHLRLVWPPLEVAGSGSVSLDDELRPLGAFTAEVVGYGELIGAFAAAGQLTANQAEMAATVLDAMAKSGADGVERLSVPVSVQGGRLYAGPIMLVEVPPVLPAE